MNQEIKVGDWVQLKEAFTDELLGVEIQARSIGQVVDVPIDEMACVMVAWEKAGIVSGIIPEEVDVLCDADFAKNEATTPKRPRRQPVKRGAA